MRDYGIAGRAHRRSRRGRDKDRRPGLDIVPVANSVDIFDHGRISAEIDTEAVADISNSIAAAHLILYQIIADGISRSEISRSGSTGNRYRGRTGRRRRRSGCSRSGRNIRVCRKFDCKSYRQRAVVCNIIYGRNELLLGIKVYTVFLTGLLKYR